VESEELNLIYFTADLHLGHANVIRHCDRPFESVEEMDESLIANWNAAVTPKDEVYILGDLTMRPAAQAHGYISRMNGRKYLIRGNHDRFLKGFAPYESDFEWVKDYHTLYIDGQCFVLFHYPILEWANYYRGSYHLYGHVHNSQTSAKLLEGLKGSAFNVGVDVNGYRPVSVTEIIQRAEETGRKARYATLRGTSGDSRGTVSFKRDADGSDKRFGFVLPAAEPKQ
jgi:calcineurin-like phosphoesterase family protein